MKTSAASALFITKPRNFVRKPQKFNMVYGVTLYSVIV